MKYVIALFLLSLVALSPAHAQNTSLGIHPPIYEIEAKKPASIEAPLIIFNKSDQSITLDIKLLPFVPSEKNDGSVMLIEENQIDEVMKSFLKNVYIIDNDRTISEITLEPNTEQELLIQVPITENDSAGDYYFSVLFITKDNNSQDTSSTAIPAGIATNILLSILPKGETIASINTFHAPKFALGGPLSFELAIKNDSDHYIQPTGNMTIYNLFGNKVAQLDIPTTNILSHSTRYLLDNAALESQKRDQFDKDKHPAILWDEGFLFGVYKANIHIRVPGIKDPLKDTRYIIVLPLQVLVLTISICIIVISIGFRVYKKVKLQK